MGARGNPLDSRLGGLSNQPKIKKGRLGQGEENQRGGVGVVGGVGGGLGGGVGSGTLGEKGNSSAGRKEGLRVYGFRNMVGWGGRSWGVVVRKEKKKAPRRRALERGGLSLLKHHCGSKWGGLN